MKTALIILFTALATLATAQENPGGTHWTTDGGNVHYSTGNIGMGTTAESAYGLAVDGHIHTQEVKVDLDGWADHVFAKGYGLPTLEEVQRHIVEKGHLINIPSAAEVAAKGTELGEMNRLLLEKVEELTLYILAHDAKRKELQARIALLKRQAESRQ